MNELHGENTTSKSPSPPVTGYPNYSFLTNYTWYFIIFQVHVVLIECEPKGLILIHTALFRLLLGQLVSFSFHVTFIHHFVLVCDMNSQYLTLKFVIVTRGMHSLAMHCVARRLNSALCLTQLFSLSLPVAARSNFSLCVCFHILSSSPCRPGTHSQGFTPSSP